MDKGADAKSEIGERKSRGGGLGIHGGGAFGGAGECVGKAEKRANGSKEGEKRKGHGSVHDVFAEALFSCQQTEDEQNKSDVGGDKGGFMDGAGQQESRETQNHITKGKSQSDRWHSFVTSLTFSGGK